MPAVVKMFGAHLKASAAMVRLRLYDVLSLLPPKTYEGMCRWGDVMITKNNEREDWLLVVLAISTHIVNCCRIHDPKLLRTLVNF